MKIFLDFEPCIECKNMMNELCDPKMLFADEKTRADESAKFLRHLTYNHTEVVQAVINELPKQKKKEEFDFFK
ncbi:MAG: hypothetical protein NPMRTH1_980002 [Nitrosopumilales archaeon]|nr:MAG: hypothetical protein NPMRTH1_980002 [Nitrosopumilales archaeon]